MHREPGDVGDGLRHIRRRQAALQLVRRAAACRPTPTSINQHGMASACQLVRHKRLPWTAEEALCDTGTNTCEDKGCSLALGRRAHRHPALRPVRTVLRGAEAAGAAAAVAGPLVQPPHTRRLPCRR